jgi:hypothetical protein
MVLFLKSGLRISFKSPSQRFLILLFLQVDLANLCMKAGVKNLSTVFLMADAQVADERFLVLINDLLASGKRLCTSVSPIESEEFKGGNEVQG